MVGLVHCNNAADCWPVPASIWNWQRTLRLQTAHAAQEQRVLPRHGLDVGKFGGDPERIVVVESGACEGKVAADID